MKRFKNILYVLSDNPDQEAFVAEKVKMLAMLNDAKVTIVRLYEESSLNLLGATLTGRFQEVTMHAKIQQQEELDRFVANPVWKGLNVAGELLQGKDFIAVIQKVLRDNHDLVIKGGAQTRGIDQLSMRLIRKCPCAVWIIRTTHTGEFRRILAAVDVGTVHEESENLNKKIIELAFSLAQREQGEAYCFHAWQLEHESMMRGPRFNFEDEELDQFKAEILRARQNGMRNLLERSNIPITEKNIHIIEGPTVDAIEEVLDDLRVDVLVIGTVARSGIQGLLIGNTVENILNKLSCTVLAVKPEGFVSPVTL